MPYVAVSTIILYAAQSGKEKQESSINYIDVLILNATSLNNVFWLIHTNKK